jgi:hypothetical protein
MASRTARMHSGLPLTGELHEDTSFPEIRKCLGPQYRYLPAEYIEQIIEQSFGEGVNPEDVEGLFGDIGNFVKKTAKSVSQAMPAVGKAVAGALPTVLPMAGTVLGTAFGGPLGGALGGTLGSALGGAVGSAVSPAGKKPAIAPAKAAGALGSIAGIAGAAIGKKPSAGALGGIAGMAGSALGGTSAAAGGGAAAQLLKTLLQPKVVQSLQAMALGPAGLQSIPVAGKQVPISAIANLIGTLANQAVEEHHHALQMNMGESDAAYLLDTEGVPLVDIASPEQRAAVVLSLLQQESINQMHRQAQLPHRGPVMGHRHFESQEDMDQYYDMLELASLYEDSDDRELY